MDNNVKTYISDIANGQLGNKKVISIQTIERIYRSYITDTSESK